MKTIKRMLEMRLTSKDRLKFNRALAFVMLPMFLFQMLSLNLLFIHTAVAEDGLIVATVTPAPPEADEEETPPAEGEKTEEAVPTETENLPTEENVESVIESPVTQTSEIPEAPKGKDQEAPLVSEDNLNKKDIKVQASSSEVISYSDFEGEIAPKNSNNWTNGNISGYKEGDKIRFRTELTASGAGSGRLFIGFTSDSSCPFFTYENPTEISLPLGYSGSLVSLSKEKDDAIAEFLINSSSASSGKFGFTLKVSELAAGCASGSSQHVQIDHATGDIKDSGAKALPIPASAVAPVTDISIVKNAPAIVSVGGSIQYAMTITNNDSSTAAANVILTDNLPSGVSFSSGSWTKTPSGSGNCSAVDQTVTCNIGNLAGGATASVTINGTVDNNNQLCASNLVNNVSVSTTTLESDYTNNSDQATTEINQCLGSITVVKNVINDNGGTNEASDFGITFSGGSLNFGGGIISGPYSKTYSSQTLTLDSGKYTLSENDLSGYTEGTWSCGTTSPGGRTTSIDLTAGQNIICSITNDDIPAKLKVCKFDDVDGDGLFDAGEEWLSGWTMTLTKSTAIVASGDTGEDGCVEFDDLSAGNYVVTETLKEDWRTITGLWQNVSLTVGDDETIYFGNQRLGRIIVHKDVTSPNGDPVTDTSHNFKVTKNDADEESITDGGTVTYNGLIAGSYTIKESFIPAGYALVSIWPDADPGAEGAQVTVAPGGTINVYVTNKIQGGSIRIIKDAQPDGAANFTFSRNFGSNFQLDDDNSLSLEKEIVFGNLMPGSYWVAENTYTAWVLASIICDDPSGNSTVDLAARKAHINLGADETVICTFTNVKRGNITLVKNSIGSDGTFDFNMTGDSLPPTDHLTTSNGTALVTYNNINTLNPYSISEVSQTGWTLVSAVCNNGDPVDFITLDPGENVVCTFTNARESGSLAVTKIIDADGDLATTDDQAPASGWQFDVDGTGIDTTDAPAGYTGLTGVVTFGGLKSGTYTIVETKQAGYDLVGADCGTENGTFDTIDSMDGVSVMQDEVTTCVFYNTPNGTIHGYKWSDEDGSGGPAAGMGEEKLSGWTINLYKNNGEDYEQIGSMDTDSSSEHLGWYWFEHLLPGDYKVCEELKDGWTQTYPGGEDNCHQMTLPAGNSSAFPLPESTNYVSGPEYNFGNRFIQPELTIEKFNNQWPAALQAGDVVDYTIIVRVAGNDVKNVEVTDLMPEGFEFVSGGATQGDLAKMYASPGVWSLGDLEAGDTVTINYKAKTSASQAAGTYKDLAWAKGTDGRRTVILATNTEANTRPAGNDDTGVISGTDNFVGTKIALATSPDPRKVELDEDTKTKTKVKRRVLGASTSLPATGSRTGWVTLAVVMMAIGVLMLAKDRKKKPSGDISEDKSAGNNDNQMKENIMKILAVTLLGTGLIFGGVRAARAESTVPPTIRLEQPATPTSQNNLKIGFVVLDIENRDMTVECWKDGPDSLGAVKFQTINIPAGGNSGICDASMAQDGAYDFFAKVTAGTDEANSGSVTVILNRQIPGTPLDYDRDGDSCNLSFKTANDGLTAKVELYRAKDNEFTADASTYVTAVNIGPDTNGNLSDPLGNCDDYLYAIRALSAAGLGSEFVGDDEVHTKTKTKTKTVRRGGVTESGAIPVTGGGTASGEAENEVAGEEKTDEEKDKDGSVAGEAVETKAEGGPGGMAKRINGFWLLAALALGAGGYYVWKNKFKEKVPAVEIKERTDAAEKTDDTKKDE